MGSCKRCEDSVLSEKIKPFLFNEGTYWVYSDSANAGFDTIRVSNASYGFGNPRNRPTNCTGDAVIETHQMTLLMKQDTFTIGTIERMHLASSSLNLYGYIFDPELSSNQCSKYENSLCFLGKTNLAVGINNFTAVYIVSAQLYNNNRSDTLPVKLYLADNIGAVKIEIGDAVSSILELQSWHIVQ